MTIADLPTPTLLLDLDRFEANCARALARAADLSVTFRPHLKTMKSVDAARVALGAERGPITVSTLREAEYFHRHGFSDIFYAVCVTPDKLARAAALIRAGAALSLLVDSAEAVDAMAAAAVREGVTFDAWIEIDSGEHRTGLLPGDPALVALGQRIDATTGMRLKGVATHAGHSYAFSTPPELRAVAEAERAAAVAAAEALRSAGIPCAHVSVGSTPTFFHAEHLTGVTEARAGVYMAGDLVQAGIGAQALDDIAVSVLATVVSHRRSPAQLVLDAGGLALSKDRGGAPTDPHAGYGRLVDADGGDTLGLPLVAGVYQEHGLVPVADPALFDRLPIGARVRVLPNHACMTAAMYDAFTLVRGTEVVGVWPRVNGW
jgi:D-serine deaminase-like pyridoxal phosphate-dependent protein